MDKETLREMARNRRAKIPAPERLQAGKEAAHWITRMVHKSPVCTACVSIPVGTEFPVVPLIRALLAEKIHVWLAPPRPRVTFKDGFIAASQLVDYPDGEWAVCSAQCSLEIVPPDQIELFVVPGLAFTSSGLRLGQGGGYYDRLLAQRNVHSRVVAPVFVCQLFPGLPLDPWDQPVDEVAAFPRTGTTPVPV